MINKRKWKDRLCYECGEGKIRKVEIRPHIFIPTCDQCGAEWMDEETAEALTMEEEIRKGT